MIKLGSGIEIDIFSWVLIMIVIIKSTRTSSSVTKEIPHASATYSAGNRIEANLGRGLRFGFLLKEAEEHCACSLDLLRQHG